MAPRLLVTHEWPAEGTDAGAPAPVAVLVHGITGWWRTWWRVGPALAEQGWRVVAVDQRGHGRSPPIDGVATAESLADDVESTLDAAGVVPVDLLVAHSLGAAVCMELVNGRPTVARRLVIEDPPGTSRADDPDYQATLEREVLAARTDPEGEARRELAENPRWLEEDARQNVEGRALCDLDGILASLRSDTGLRVLDLVPAIDIPTLYVLADEERSVLGSRRDELIGSAPAMATVVELDAGHTVHRDRFDEYVASILGWVRSSGST